MEKTKEINAIYLLHHQMLAFILACLVYGCYFFTRILHIPSVQCNQIAEYSHKYYSSTVSDEMLIVLYSIVPLAVILTSETLRMKIEKFKYQRIRYMINILNRTSIEIPIIMVLMYRKFGSYLVGLGFVSFLTQLGKVTVGRMRPYFMQICDPQFNANITSLSELCNFKQVLYMDEDFVCKIIDKNKLFEAQLSFPSGHATQSFYAMTFLCLYFNTNWYHVASFLRIFAQFVFISLASFVSATRISDNKHFYSDVSVGTLMGVITAYFTFFKLTKHQEEKPVTQLREPNNEDTILLRC